MDGSSENYIPQEVQPDQAVGAEPQSESAGEGAPEQAVGGGEPAPELTEEDAKLQELLALAAKDGVDKAVAAAKELDPRVQELFHDTLANNPEWSAQLKGHENI